MQLSIDLSKLPVLAEGGEGIIYEYNSQIIKRYKPQVDISSKKKKIESLMRKQLPPEVVKPIDTVYDNKNQFIGYIMNKVDGEEFKKLTNKKFLTSNNITTKDIIGMLVKLQNVLAVLHTQNIFIGDLNDQNILFDNHFNIYIIDCDSWTIDSERCDVAMDLFKDPKLKSNDFNSETDTFAFSVLTWRSLTRIHPYGGTLNPDINILDRMIRGISVIDNPAVTIPRTIKSWNNLSPSLISSLKAVFENKSRILKDELSEFYSDLKFCKVDNEYYYGKYMSCPICNKNATVVTKPISQGTATGLALIAVLNADLIKTVIDQDIYLDKNDYIINIKSNQKVKYEYGHRYYFTSDDTLIVDDGYQFVINGKENYTFRKKHKTPIYVDGDMIHFISEQNVFTSIKVLPQGNSIKNIAKTSNNVYYAVNKENYCIINYYADKLIAVADGYTHVIPYKGEIINYGISHDTFTGKWLVILEDKSGVFTTLIIDGTGVLYETNKIKYACALSNVCLANSTIFIPIDGKIRGFSYEKSAFKDFECGIVDENSKLLRTSKKFTIINDENIYLLG